ncbi:50S ribosomal protein L13 [bacterium]|nr:50S ribosomal protein L13 [bacterium]
MKTRWTKTEDVKRDWHLIDAKDQVLGRLATRIASLLIGKSKVSMVPNLDNGDYVVVINSEKIKLTRGKEFKKMYYSHSGYPGGFKELRFDEVMKRDARKPITLAVKRMLPSNKLRAGMIARLFVYKDENHKHQAQNPVAVNLTKS